MSRRLRPGSTQGREQPDPAADAARVLASFCGSSGPSPRTLIIAAHQDDEVIGAGARIAALPEVAILHTTDGSPADLGDAQAAGFASAAGYACARADEVRAALATAGKGDVRVDCLGFGDQCCARSLATLARVLAQRISAAQVEVVLTHAYEGGHPDHDATAFATHAALALLEARGESVPVLLEMTGYHLHAGAIRTGVFLTGHDVPHVELPLGAAERELKRRMLASFVTQRGTLAAFSTEREAFRVAPRYDFTHAPSPEGAYYDHYTWGLRSHEWPELVRRALAELRQEAATC